MKDDPIVEEIRQYRREIMAEHGNDLGKLCAALRVKEKQSGRKVVHRKPRLIMKPTGS